MNCVIYTSGTTGPSKGVPITNAHGISKAIEVIRLAEMGEHDVIYAPLPLFHSFALLRGVCAGLVDRRQLRAARALQRQRVLERRAHDRRDGRLLRLLDPA